MATDICRLCLQSAGSLLSIYGPYNDKYNLMDIMYELTLMEILENDNLPSQICDNCAKKLVDFHEFRQMLLDSHVKLLSTTTLSNKQMKRKKKIHAKCDSNGVKRCKQKRCSRKKCIKIMALLSLQLSSSSTSSISSSSMSSTSSCKSNDLKRKSRPKSKKMFICDICERVFKRRSHIQTHLLGVHFQHLKTNITKKTCPYCPRMFTVIEGRSNIPRHIKTVHKNIVCSNTSTNLNSNDTESFTESKSAEIIQCTHCAVYFSNIIEMYVHLQSHEIDTNETKEGYNLHCDDCNQEHLTLDSYIEHMSQVHSVADRKSIKLIKCRWCKERFCRIQGLYSHIRSTHKCFNNNEMAKTSQAIQRSPNFNRSDSLLCTECGRVLSSPSSLVAHLKTHNDVRPHQCYICDTSFKHVISLKQHMAIHSNERKFKCEICEKSFKQMGHLKTHQMSHGIGVQWFLCDLCDKKFYTKGNFKEHMLVHGNKRHKKYDCGSCFKQFSRKHELNAHTLEEHVEIEYM